MRLSNYQRYVELCMEQEPTRTTHTTSDTPTYPERSTLDRVAEALGVSVSALTGRCRTPDAAQQRQTAMWLLSRAGLSSVAIGRLLERDHSTVLYGLRRIEARRGDDDAMAE